MNLSELQAELRHFAAERDWQPFHTPKNLSTALLVEAAELAEIFQWMTPEQSQAATLDPDKKGRIAGEVADVLLYLLQLADHCQIDMAQAVVQKLGRNAQKYPPVRTIAQVSPANAAVPGVHVLLDYENVQPSEEALRALVPDASQVWVFHGPHQRQVEKSFAGFGDAVTAVPISKTGKNALDFHLSFYVGYIASRNPLASLVVVANDKGYAPMLTHARDLGFAARQLGHGRARATAAVKAKAQPVVAAAEKALEKKAPEKKAAAKKATLKPVQAKRAPAKQAPAKQAPTKQAPAKQAVAKKAAATPTAAAKKVAPAKKATAAKKTSTPKAVTPAQAPAKVRAPAPAPVPKSNAPAARTPKAVKAGPADPATLKRLVDNLRKMGDQRPIKAKSLWRLLKSLLGAGTTDDAVEQALGRLIGQGIVKVNSVTGVSYPQFAR